MRKEVLRDLINALSPSGFEGPAIQVFDHEMEGMGATKYYSDKIGNSGWSIGHGPVSVLLSGHVDAISGRIQHITDDGMISFISVGGMDRKALIGSEVIILGRKGPVKGIIGKKPIHIEYYLEDEKDTVCKIHDLRVDIGAETKKEVLEAGIMPGLPLVHSRCIDLDFGTHRLRGNELDDKLGAFSVLEIFHSLLEEGFDQDRYTIIGLATVQEETGLRGATIAAKNINPDYSIDFDVCPATDGDLEIDKFEHGDIKLGKGIVVSWGPEKSARLCEAFNKIAEENGVVVQNETSSAGGTNTDQFQLMARDCECALLSFPNRNMHTPVEVCDWRDVEGAVVLITKMIQDGTIL